jgi:hypothetical protein
MDPTFEDLDEKARFLFLEARIRVLENEVKHLERRLLAEGEPHPAAQSAKVWIAKIPFVELMEWKEALASAALGAGDMDPDPDITRMAEVCSETLARLLDGKPVSDRYVLGLAWLMKEIRPFAELHALLRGKGDEKHG